MSSGGGLEMLGDPGMVCGDDTCVIPGGAADATGDERSVAPPHADAEAVSPEA